MAVGGVGAFACPGVMTAKIVFTNSTLRLWEMYGIPPLQCESCPISVAGIHVAFDCQRWGQDKVVAQQWGKCYVMQFNVHPSVVRAKSYGKFTVTCDEGCSLVRSPRGRLHSL